MKFSEDQLKEFAKPLSQTEENQCKNAIGMVADALKDIGLREEETIHKSFSDTPSYQLRMSGNYGYEVKIFLQGSYANNTNVRRNSDVDIAVVQEDRFRTKYREGINDSYYGFTKATPRERSFKDEVEIALRKKFGSDVIRKNKSIRINGNSYRNDADSVPALRYRDYTNDYRYDSNNFIGGIVIKPDKGSEIINYPEEHIKNGIEKNKRTNYYFKKMVRIAKEMRYKMIESNYSSAQEISSFLVECLIWNAPDEYFTKYINYRFIFDEILSFLYSNLNDMISFKEVNNIKYIWRDDPDRLKYCENFIKDLYRFYEYEI